MLVNPWASRGDGKYKHIWVTPCHSVLLINQHRWPTSSNSILMSWVFFKCFAIHQCPSRNVTRSSWIQLTLAFLPMCYWRNKEKKAQRSTEKPVPGTHTHKKMKQLLFSFCRNVLILREKKSNLNTARSEITSDHQQRIWEITKPTIFYEAMEVIGRGERKEGWSAPTLFCNVCHLMKGKNSF